MKIQSFVHILITGSAIVLASQSARAGPPEAGQLKGKIQAFYMQMNEGSFEEAFFKFVQSGSAGFLPRGMQVQIPNEAVRERIAQNATAERAGGKQLAFNPKHMDIKIRGRD